MKRTITKTKRILTVHMNRMNILTSVFIRVNLFNIWRSKKNPNNNKSNLKERAEIDEFELIADFKKIEFNEPHRIFKREADPFELEQETDKQIRDESIADSQEEQEDEEENEQCSNYYL